MVVIGLTGQIASGKTAVALLLHGLGSEIVDCDRLARDSYEPGAPAFDPVVARFGPSILAADGAVDRVRLADLVFSDAEALADLEAIVHPRVKLALDERLRQATHDAVVVEAIKLIEAGLHRRCGSLWVVTAPAELRVQRLVHLRGMDEAAARARVAAQGSDEDKLRAAHEVIVNDGNRIRLARQVEAAWERTTGWARG
jgi:dephospho-CoA kinase